MAKPSSKCILLSGIGNTDPKGNNEPGSALTLFQVKNPDYVYLAPSKEFCHANGMINGTETRAEQTREIMGKHLDLEPDQRDRRIIIMALETEGNPHNEDVVFSAMYKFLKCVRERHEGDEVEWLLNASSGTQAMKDLLPEMAMDLLPGKHIVLQVSDPRFMDPKDTRNLPARIIEVSHNLRRYISYKAQMEPLVVQHQYAAAAQVARSMAGELPAEMEDRVKAATRLAKRLAALSVWDADEFAAARDLWKKTYDADDPWERKVLEEMGRLSTTRAVEILFKWRARHLSGVRRCQEDRPTGALVHFWGVVEAVMSHLEPKPKKSRKEPYKKNAGPAGVRYLWDLLACNDEEFKQWADDLLKGDHADAKTCTRYNAFDQLNTARNGMVHRLAAISPAQATMANRLSDDLLNWYADKFGNGSHIEALQSKTISAELLARVQSL